MARLCWSTEDSEGGSNGGVAVLAKVFPAKGAARGSPFGRPVLHEHDVPLQAGEAVELSWNVDAARSAQQSALVCVSDDLCPGSESEFGENTAEVSFHR